jgi:hypothetical protein
MCHAHPTNWHAPRGQKRDSGPAQRQSGEVIARSGHKKACLPSSAIVAGLVLALLGNIAHASNRTTILQYICTTYESARQVALEQGWERPESIPGDCRTLFTRGFDERIAEVSQIVEVVPIEDGRWIEIGKVRLGSVETGYSAGITEQLLLF